MAVICEQYKLLFIGNRRTASTAIGRALEEHIGGVYVPAQAYFVEGEKISKRHVTIEQLKRHNLLSCDMDTLHKCVGVRNPYDSLVSKYIKCRYRPNRAGSIYQREKMNFEQFINHLLQGAKPESMHACFVEGCDKIIYFEALQEGLSEMLNEVSAPDIILPVVNKTDEKKSHYSAYYNDKTRDIVEKIFYQDLVRFDYTFEDLSNGQKIID